MYLNSFNYFRGITIISIVAGHCYGLSAYQMDTWLQRLVINLVSGNAALFVFISGFLFYHIFYPRYQYGAFLAKKSLFVLVPYLLLSILPIYAYVFNNNTGHHHDFGITDPLSAIGFYYLTGATLVSYWYIPFIMVIFALSPMFIWFIRTNPKQQMIFMLIGALIAIIVHRPIDLINPLQSLLYYIPVYSFGIWAALNQEKIYAYWDDKLSLLLLLVFSLALYQALFYDNTGNFHKAIFEWGVLDINFIQKMFLAVFFTVWLHRFEERDLPWGLSKTLALLASYSFPIYFLHPMVIWEWHKHLPAPPLLNLPWYAYFILVVSVVMLLSLVIAMLIKRLFGKRSRYLIGG